MCGISGILGKVREAISRAIHGGPASPPDEWIAGLETRTLSAAIRHPDPITDGSAVAGSDPLTVGIWLHVDGGAKQEAHWTALVLRARLAASGAILAIRPALERVSGGPLPTGTTLNAAVTAAVVDLMPTIPADATIEIFTNSNIVAGRGNSIVAGKAPGAGKVDWSAFDAAVTGRKVTFTTLAKTSPDYPVDLFAKPEA